MKHKILLAAFVGVIGLTTLIVSCGKSGGKSESGNTTDSVLINLGTNVILPSYQQVSASTADMDAAVTAFVAAPSSPTLTSLQTAFKTSYKSWGAVSEFEFGPAADLSLTTHFVNSFPADTGIITGNINGAAYVIDGLGNYAAQGFPALDFLLFANGNAYVLSRFTTGSHATGAKQYLSALSASLKTKTAAVATAWSPSGGNYLATFNKKTGVDAGSSLSLLVNAYVKDFDVTLQNFKIGIPIGLYGPNVLPKSPAKVEAYYSGYSVQLLIAQMQAIQNIYLGSAGTGLGLDDKVAATGAQRSGVPLNDAIKNQITTLTAKIQALPEPLSTGVQNGATSINDAYTEVRKMTVLLKVDMCSALGIRISFQDDDGD